MKKILFPAVIAAMLLCGVAAAAAGQTSPIATIAFSGYDELIKDIECIGKLSGRPDLVKMIDGLIAMQTQGRGLAGLDKTRPWGVVVTAGNGPMPSGYGFIPVSKLEELLETIRQLGLEVSPAAAGSYKISGSGGREFYVKQRGDWACVCTSEAGFAEVADDPASLLGETATQYNLSVRLLFKNIPPPLREMILGLLQMRMAAYEQMPGEGDEAYELRMQVMRGSLAQAREMFEQLDSFFIGIAVDEKTGSAYMDMELKAVDGSDCAEQISTFKRGRTDFGGFYQTHTALTFCTFATLGAKQQQQSEHTLAMYHAMLVQAIDGDEALGDDNKAETKQLAGKIIKVLQDTIASGRSDMAAAVALAPARSALIAGASVADGAAVDEIARQLVQIAGEEHPEAAGMFRLDADEHAGVRFHTFGFALPEMENREIIAGIIGQQLKLVLGVGEKRIYLGVGQNALEKLKAAIERSGSMAAENVQPLRMSLSAAPVAKLAGELSDEFELKIAASSIASALAESGGEDHITLVGDSIDNGFRYRITLEKGILKILSMFPTMMMAAGM